MDPLVSILIPTFNSETFIGRALASARAQTHQSIEIIVSDNASTDRTVAVVEATAALDRRIKLVKNGSNRGPVWNWIRCAEQATGRYACLLFADDYLYPSFLERTMQYLQLPDVGVVFTATVLEDFPAGRRTVVTYLAPNASTGIHDVALLQQGYFALPKFILPMSPACAVFRTQDLLQSLRFELPAYDACCVRAHGAGPDVMAYILAAVRYSSFAYVTDPLVVFSQHANNLSNQSITAAAYFATRSEAYDMFSPKAVTRGEHMAYRLWMSLTIRSALREVQWRPSLSCRAHWTGLLAHGWSRAKVRLKALSG